MSYFYLAYWSFMKLYLSERFTKFEHICERPLICSDFASWSPHKCRTELIYNQYSCDYKRICPHNGKLYLTSLSIKLNLVVIIADNHDVENRIITRVNTFSCWCIWFVPYLKYFNTIQIHDLRTSISKSSKQIHISINEG